MNTHFSKWQMLKIGDDRVSLDIKPGFACGKKDVDRGVPHLRMNNISPDGHADFSLVRRIPKAIAEKKERWLQSGDVLFCNTNSTDLVGKTCLFTGWKEQCTYSNHLTRLRANPENVLPQWLAICLRHLWISRYFATHCTEFIGQSAFNKNKLKEIEIPIPPLGEQRRIVARIEELTRRAEEARRLRQEAVKGVESSLAATVHAVFHERDSDWTEARVKQLCGKPQYGYTASASNEKFGPHFLRITDIQDGHVDWDSVPYCLCDESEKYRLSDGDIVFARTGATTGKSYLVHDPPESIFASYLIRIRPGDRVLPEYIWWYFQSSSYWAAVYSGIDDGNRPNMNGTKLGALKIPFPKSKKTQRQIVSLLETLGEKIAELRELQNTSEAESSAFQPSLLAKAFRGEL